jgi:APA family basic amino acid/polyamine antiporter
VGWLLLGILVYVVYRRRQGLDLTSTHKVAIAQPVVDHEAEYDSVLVHVGDGDYNEQLLATAAKLAARKRRGIHVLVTSPCRTRWRSTRRWSAEAVAESIIEQAKLQAGRRVTGHWEKVRAGQAGRRIIEEAQDMRAAAVVIVYRGGSPAHRVRQDARDGARGTTMPGDHRVLPRPTGGRPASAYNRAPTNGKTPTGRA